MSLNPFFTDQSKRLTVWSWDATYPAPAKINLFLHITGRRQDGYHTLQTLFRFLDIQDTLYFTPRSDDKILLISEMRDTLTEKNLVVRAAKKLREMAGIRHGVTIHLEKNLPVGAGLGGGSSNAATLLIALNNLWGVKASYSDLLELGLTLGADVPVFLGGHSAIGESIGEVLTPLCMSPEWYLIIYPKILVKTEKVFSAFRLCQNVSTFTHRDYFSILKRGISINDLEVVVAALYPEVASAMRWLSKQPETKGRVGITGSGACIFSIFHDMNLAKQLLDRLPKIWQGWVASGVDQHPLYHLIHNP